MEQVPLVVALYAGHPLARRTTLRRTELKNEAILYMSPSATGDSYGDSYFMALYRQAGYQPNILLRSNDVESILMMVAAEELWLDVDLIRLGDISQKNFSNNQYVLSAILKA